MRARSRRRPEPAPALVGERVRFAAARPIWPKGREREKNLFVGFRAVFEAPETEKTVLRITAASLYRAFINGEFVGYGPARGPHGYFRVDEWDLTGRLGSGKNIVAIEVAGYNVNSYYLLDQPAFVQAEVLAGDRVLVATGKRGTDFAAGILSERVQKVQRYSFQRPFSEVYRLRPGYDAWRREHSVKFGGVTCGTFKPKKLLPRRVPYPMFNLRAPMWHVACGTLKPGVKPEELCKKVSLTGIGPQLRGYREGELETIPSIELQSVATVITRRPGQRLEPAARLKLDTNSFHIVDFGTNLTGFLGAQIACRQKTRFFMLFDEILRDGDVDFKRLGCVNIVGYELRPGEYRIEALEPYTLRYLKLAVLEGRAEVQDIYLREYANPQVWAAHYAASDERLNRLFEAGRETFRQNALDVFMDCPSRERAGWLCDSFFTSRVAPELSGDTTVERNFFENFLLPTKFEHLPSGMLPMCYPSDSDPCVFIPNWALWFVIELEEYVARSGDRQMADGLKPKVTALFDYLRRFGNSDGLLEKLEGLVFVEHSKANQFGQDVNYPTNMLYAGALDAAGRLYRLPRLVAQAKTIREAIRRKSFDGTFFVDNAVRKDGELQLTQNRTEACQYYAFFFDVATPDSHAGLWRTLCEDFGPQRTRTGLFREIHPANSFVGNMLRVEILSRYGRCQQILDESMQYLLYMAERTGTLWEHVGDYGSCCQGFASHVVHTLYRDILGLYHVDPVNRRVQVRLAELKLDWSCGRVPVPGGAVALQWRREAEQLIYSIDVPAGWSVEIENLTGKRLVRRS